MSPGFSQERMDITRMKRLRSIFVLLALVGASPAAAQQGLEARMRGFLHAVQRMPVDSVAPFFPRRGTWTWVVTTHGSALGDRVGAWRFDAQQTLQVIREGGPACQSFTPPGDVGGVGVLINEAWEHPWPWRRVRGNRFVPRGASAASPLFVEWRREDGRWVVSSYGDQQWRRPRLLGVGVHDARRDPVPHPPLTDAIPEGEPRAEDTRWFVENEPITFEGMHYIKYGLSRALAPGDVTRIATLDGVALYAETGDEGGAGYLYVPVGSSLEFQPYQAFGSPPCYDPGAPGEGR